MTELIIKENTTDEEIAFLKESNAIEDVFDDDSLQQAIYAWEYLKTEKKLSVGVILKLHKILMLHQKLMPNEIGYLRTVDIYIGQRCGMPPEDLHELLEGFCLLMNDKSKLSEDEFKIAHVSYETIHPFVDGNGRTGRMLMNWHRLKHKKPILIIKASERNEYYKWFEEFSV